ncbi:peptidase [Paraburkholderia fungorum]|uniref:Peptidase n=2 Tax=Paraburkholderia fungorum TaxID=134537 RepID=A0A3R7HK43_9BURK|nr:peptidase [Paraburkholderia fungorum]
MAPSTNGDLDGALHIAKAAWATCAAKVDMVVTCQAKGTNRTAPAADHD